MGEVGGRKGEEERARLRVPAEWAEAVEPAGRGQTGHQQNVPGAGRARATERVEIKGLGKQSHQGPLPTCHLH